MGSLLVFGGVAAAMVVLTTLAVYRLQRSLEQPGGREGLGMLGDAFGNLIDVFDPGQARAQRDLRHEEHKGPVLPSPDDGDDPVRLLTGPDGRPWAVRVRRTSGWSRGTSGRQVGTRG